MTRRSTGNFQSKDCNREQLAAGLRLDPSLQQGPRGRGLLWAVTSIVAIAILVIFFAIGHTDSTAQNQLTPTITTGASRR